MKRVILDTNIYGRIIERKEEEEIQRSLEKRKDVVICGFDAVRKELRDLSGETFIGKRKLRILLLTLYNRIARTHIYLTTSLDIVVSEDNKTMFSNEAASAYRTVNNLKKYMMPEFIGYEKFRRLFS